MRACIIGAVCVAALAGSAMAEPWSAEDSRLVFETPAGWATARAPNPARTYVVARGQGGECHFLSVPREATAAETPYRVRLAGREPVAETVWTSLPAAMPRVFGEARLVSRRVDADGFWPIHFGRYEGGSRTVHAAAQFRPGMEFWGFCFAAAESTSTENPFDTVLRSIGDKNDAEMRASIEEEETRRLANVQADVERSMEEQRRRFESLPAEVLGLGNMGGGGAPSSGASGGGGGGSN